MGMGTIRMKKVLLIMMALLLTSNLTADVNQGKRYYMKHFKQKLKMSGLDFVQLHTQAQWQQLFDNNASGFVVEFSKKYPQHAAYLNSPRVEKKLQDLGDFAVEYASDSGKLPSCGDEKAVEKPIDLQVEDSSSANYF